MSAVTQTFPELLARDLARSQDVFRTRSLTAGAPAASLALECQPPRVPWRNPAHAATSTLHRATSETSLCSQHERASDRADTARQDVEEWPLRGPGPRHSSLPGKGHAQVLVVKEVHMKQDDSKDGKRFYLNSLDDGWVSDSSVEFEPGTSSPSFRTRKQSVTTAATSVEIRSVLGATEICLSPTGSLGRDAPRAAGKSGRSWVDLDAGVLMAEQEVEEGVASIGTAGHSDRTQTQPRATSTSTAAAAAAAAAYADQAARFNVPWRRSSLSHQLTAAAAPPKPDLGLVSQLSTPPSPQKPSPCLSQPIQPVCTPQCPLAATPQVQRPPPREEEAACDAFDTHQELRQYPNLLHKLRKTQSHSKMPIITQVQSWLDSSASTTHLTSSTQFNAHSPTSKGPPLGNVRVAAEVLENLRISVGNFPDTMLRTSSLTVQTIRSYSRKLRRGGAGSGDRGFARDSDDFPWTVSEAGNIARAPIIESKSSFGNLRFKKLSLRGRKLHLGGSREAPPQGLPFQNDDDDFWPSMDHHNVSMRSNTPPSPRSSDASACVAALRCIFPNGTDYLLDGLYAHVIAYNYMNSLCGSLPHLLSSPGHPGLRPRPSMTFPPGVTSRADLALQDRDDRAMRELQDDVAACHAAPNAVVPKKAASLLGLGATNMGRPVKPRPGTLGGRRDAHRKTTPPAASFSASLESDSAMRDLRDAIASNIRRLVETVRQCSSAAAAGRDSDEDSDDAAVLDQNAKDLEPVLLRALCEVVRCYEELC